MTFNFNYKRSLFTGYAHAAISGLSSVIVFGLLASKSTDSNLGFLGLFISSIALSQIGLSILSGTVLRKMTSLVQKSSFDDAKEFSSEVLGTFLIYSLTSIFVILLLEFFFGVNPLRLEGTNENRFLYLGLYCLNIFIFSGQSSLKLFCLSFGDYPKVNLVGIMSSLFILTWCLTFRENLLFSYILSYTISGVFSVLYLFTNYKKYFSDINFNFIQGVGVKTIKKIMNFHDSVSAVLNIIVTNEIVILGWIVGVGVAGEFSRNWRYPELFLGLIMKMFEQMYPILINDEDAEKVRKTIKNALLISLVGFASFSTVYIFFGDVLAKTFFGSRIGFNQDFQFFLVLLLPLMLLDKICFNLRYPSGHIAVSNALTALIVVCKLLICVAFRNSATFLHTYFCLTVISYVVFSLPYSLYTIKGKIMENRSV